MVAASAGIGDNNVKSVVTCLSRGPANLRSCGAPVTVICYRTHLDAIQNSKRERKLTMASFKPSDIDPINQRNLKAKEDGGVLPFAQLSAVVAIGPGHKAEVMAAVQGPGGYKGTVMITKGKGTDPGQLEVKGSHDQAQFRNTIKRISKKVVVFK